MYRIIFSDIDGTLLNSKHEVTPDTKEAIKRLEQEGIPFILVSARMPEAMTQVRDALGIHAPMVAYSGGAVQDADGKIIYNCSMSLDLAMEIKSMLEQEFPEICCNTYGGGKWIVDDTRSHWVQGEEMITGLKAEEGIVGEAFKEDGGVNKFLLMGNEEDILRTDRRLKQLYPQLSIVRSKDVYLEVMDGSVRKSAGMQFLCSHYGYAPSETVAFGDGYNDMDMLAAAGVGYAMGNAPDEVKKHASRVTLDNDHEGLLEGLRECFPILQKEQLNG